MRVRAWPRPAAGRLLRTKKKKRQTHHLQTALASPQLHPQPLVADPIEPNFVLLCCCNKFVRFQSCWVVLTTEKYRQFVGREHIVEVLKCLSCARATSRRIRVGNCLVFWLCEIRSIILPLWPAHRAFRCVPKRALHCRRVPQKYTAAPLHTGQ